MTATRLRVARPTSPTQGVAPTTEAVARQSPAPRTASNSPEFPLHGSLPLIPEADPTERAADRWAEAADRPGFAPPPVAAAGLGRESPAAGATSADLAPPDVGEMLRNGGAPLPRPLRDTFAETFGHDFSGVRVHHDSGAAASARELNATAYTVGSHVVFAEGAFAPGTAAGRRLLAHELAHVIQQGGEPRAVQRQSRSDKSALPSALELVLKASRRAAEKPDDPTLLTLRGAEIGYRLIAESIPEFAGNISSIGFRGDVSRISAKKSAADNIDLGLGRGFILGITPQNLRARTAELRAALVATHAKPRPMPAPSAKTPPTPSTPASPAAPQPTAGEKAATTLRTNLRQNVQSRTQGSRTFTIGGVRANARARQDILAGDLLMSKADTAHLQFFGDQLGIESGFQSSGDPFRWKQLETIIAEGDVEIIAIDRSKDFKVIEVSRAGRTGPVDRSLALVGGNGATAIRASLQSAVGAPSGRGVSFVSATSRDQVFYRPGSPSIAHELFGHVWLAMHGVPSGHGESLQGTTSIQDPLGGTFTGQVDDFIGEMIQTPGKKESRSAGLTQAALDQAITAFTDQLVKPGAFVVELGAPKMSKPLGAAFDALRPFYDLLLLNRAAHAADLDNLARRVATARAKMDPDQRAHFDQIVEDNAVSASTRLTRMGHLFQSVVKPAKAAKP